MTSHPTDGCVARRTKHTKHTDTPTHRHTDTHQPTVVESDYCVHFFLAYNNALFVFIIKSPFIYCKYSESDRIESNRIESKKHHKVFQGFVAGKSVFFFPQIRRRQRGVNQCPTMTMIFYYYYFSKLTYVRSTQGTFV